MKIGPLDSGNRPIRPEEEKRQKANLSQDKPNSNSANDSVQISSDGKRLSDSARMAISSGDSTSPKHEIVAPENRNDAVRENRIEQARQRMESGYYRDAKVTEKIAGRLADEILD
ncbi:MAG: hypothetical protein GY841_09695 [FCB group bacterium]|nr:hypothetical protein [FCB group bacterium]